MLTKGFLKPGDKIFKKKFLFIGIPICLGYSVSLYIIFVIFRELFRIWSFYGSEDFMVVTRSEELFYNFFLAFLATAFGISFALKFIIENSTSRANRSELFAKRSAIVDLNFNAWNYFFWFAKIGSTLGILFITVPYFLAFEVDYIIKIFFILFASVLLINSLLSLLRAYKIKAQKYALVVFAFAIVYSLGLSILPIYKEETINKNLSRNSFFKEYKFKPPRTNYYRRVIKRNTSFQVYISSKNDTIKLFLKPPGMKYIQTSMDSLINNFNKYYGHSDFEMYEYNAEIYADTNTPYKVIEELKFNFIKLNIRNIFYATHPIKPDFQDYKYSVIKRCFVPHFLNFHFSDEIKKIDSLTALDIPITSQNIPKFWNSKFNDLNKHQMIEINIDSLGNYYLNNKKIDLSEIKNKLFNFYSTYKKSALVVLSVDDDTSYGSYMKIIDAVYSSIYQLKKELVMRKFLVEYDETDPYFREDYELREVRQYVREIYPTNLMILFSFETEHYHELKRDQKFEIVDVF